MFILKLTYKRPLAEADALLQAHKEFLQKNYEAGYFLLSGRKNPRTGGIILANASSSKMIEELIAEDPFYVNEIADYDITEFESTMFRDGLKPVLS